MNTATAAQVPTDRAAPQGHSILVNTRPYREALRVQLKEKFFPGSVIAHITYHPPVPGSILCQKK